MISTYNKEKYTYKSQYAYLNHPGTVGKGHNISFFPEKSRI